ncbi:MAG: hypothetical protein JWO81_3421 [Alphaproteobacteria bacterium]|nr:hypothetical protein [Alphaproteobacteria bacterium]
MLSKPLIAYAIILVALALVAWRVAAHYRTRRKARGRHERIDLFEEPPA